jgi:hypothetical protein
MRPGSEITDAAEKVPLKSHMKYKARKAELKKAVAWYVSRNVASVTD